MDFNDEGLSSGEVIYRKRKTGTGLHINYIQILEIYALYSELQLAGNTQYQHGD